MARSNLIRKKSLKNKKLRILFRTSGGAAHQKELGLGHVYRCMNLASYFFNHQVYFLIEDYGGLKNVLEQRLAKNTKFLKKNIDLQSDIKKTINEIVKKKIDVIIIDRYNLQSNYINNIRKHAKTVVISDLNKIKYNCDLVINGFIGFKNQEKRLHGSKCLLGPKYQILNPKFSKKIQSYQKKYDLLVTFGGFDEKNISTIILDSLSKFKNKIKIKIILGPATKKSNNIKNLIRKNDKNLVVVESTKNMFQEILNSNFGICGGGITSYEFAALNTPFGIICQVKHQLKTAKEWEKREIGVNLGLITKKTPEKIERLLEILAQNKLPIERKTSKVVDGFGGKRVSKEILNLIK